MRGPSRPPGKLRIGPLRVRVKVDRAAMDRASTDHGEQLLGQADVATCRILLEPMMTPDAMRETLLHEVLHYTCSLTGLSEHLGDKEEEQLVQRLSPILLDTLQRNPKLVAYLMRER